MTTDTIDFAAVKEAVTVSQAIDFLGLRITKRDSETQLRAACPRCKSGGDRALSMTTARNLFTCFGSKPMARGDVIALVAHVRNTGQKEAAALLAERFQLGNGKRTVGPSPRTSSPEPTGRQVASPGFRAMEPLVYLDAHHEAVQGLGVSPETLEHFGAGYASKGVMRGRLAVPIHTHDGTLIAYVGIATSDEQQPRLLFNNFEPTKYLFNLNRVTGDDGVYVARDPLDVLTAYEGGAENVISFLSPITSDGLQVLSLFMEERGIEHVEIL